MTTKLTLSLDSKVIESAKKLSKKKGVSLSKLVEEYLKTISNKDKPKNKSIVDELAGIFGPVPENFHYKKDILQRIEAKHLR